MKHKLHYFASLMLIARALSADVDSGDYGSEKIADLEEKPTPFKFDVRTDYIGSSDTKNGFFQGEKLHYGESQADISGVFYYNPCFKEALAAQVSFNNTQMYWSENPLFDQKNFNNLSIAAGGVTQRLCGWIWQGYAAINMDSRNIGLNNYTTYDLMLWGKYKYTKNLGVHVGFLGWTGLKIDKILPILGFDWTFCDKWTLNAVFPINVSLTYAFNESWSVAAAGRFFWNRHRVGKDELLSEAVWEYRNSGVELAVNYAMKNFATLNLHAGWSFGGNVYLSNKNHKYTHKYEFDGAPYAGGEIAIQF